MNKFRPSLAAAESRAANRRNLQSAVSQMPDYASMMPPSDPNRDLQSKWQSYHYCDDYSSFCSYSEVLRSVTIWDDEETSAAVPTRSTMATPNITLLLGELPVKCTVPPLDMDIYYSNVDILPDAPDSPAYTKDRIAKARSHTIHKTLDWELNLAADAFIAGPEGDEGAPSPGQMKDLQDSIGDFMALNSMFMYMRGSQNSSIADTCDLQKLVAKMMPMRVVVYSNLTDAVVCGKGGEGGESLRGVERRAPPPFLTTYQ